MTYATIGKRAQRVSQLAFLRLLKRGLAYQVEAPTLWDVDFQTAVAQAELEDREHAGRLSPHPVRARGRAGGAVEIETTRPELIPACVALVAHPDDERYKPLFGTEVVTPLFGVRVPVRAHPLADPEKGSGIAMICTFGDITDVTWWRELSLPVRAVIQPDGTLRAGDVGRAGLGIGRRRRARSGTTTELDAAVGGQGAGEDRRAAARVRRSGRRAAADHARREVLREGRSSARDRHQPAVVHQDDRVPRGAARARPRAAVASAVHAGALRELGQRPERRLVRQPPAVLRRAVSGLVSARRAGRPSSTTRPMPPREDQLPIDPSTDVPDGYRADQRGVPGGFAGDPDVMDTWATSSLTPQIVCGWPDDPELFAQHVPDGPAAAGARHHPHLAVRHGAARAARARLAAVDATRRSPGWVLDPDRKKMSKSKGNVVTPMALLEEHGSDGVRYWAASGGPGTDTAFDPSQMKVGRRLAIKMLNASKFALASAEPQGADHRAGRSRDAAQPGGARRRGDRRRSRATTTRACCSGRRRSSGGFCDDYLELVKGRRYGEQGAEGAGSANAALTAALSVMLRLFAPFLPFVTEEVWSWWQRRVDSSGARGRRADELDVAARRQRDGDGAGRSARPTTGPPTCCSRCASSGRKPSSR